MHLADHPACSAQAVVPALQIDLFGGVTISVDDRRVTDLPTRKAEALLIYLVCHPQPHQRETLADLLWDDLPAERAAGNLRLTLNQLRKRLAPFLDITRQTIAIRRDLAYRLDVRTFAELLAAQPHDLDTIAQALELYRGDFLRGFHLRDARGFAEWQAAQADHWRQQALTWMQLLVDRYTAHSRYAEAQAWAARMLRLDPLDEAAHRRMMLTLARSGQRQAAIRQYQVCQQILQEELALEPEPATELLYQRIRALPEQRQHALPPCTNLLLDRAAELARVYEWLATPTSRLMSIVGPGGSGKTQLALTVAWRVVTEYLGPCTDGVFYLSLVSSDGPESRIDDTEVLVAIAEALRVSLSGRGPPLDQLIQQLREKELLLIVDNGELLEPSARLALDALVRHAAGVRILVPSRERLKLRAEHVLNLGGLSYPVLPQHTITPQHEERVGSGISEHSSVQLFLTCSRRMQGAGNFDDYERQDQLAIGRICQIVQGLPLAIELATPWLRVRSPGEIARDIAQTLDLLATDMADVPERHRSMQAVFEYSWRLLVEREQSALANLAIFPGSFSAQAAEAIAAVVLPLLASLHDKSLVQTIKAEIETRYTLHPLLRHMALEKLQTNAAAETAARARHTRHFAAFAAQCEGQLRGSQGADVLQALEREIDNLRAGWRWAITTGDIATLGQYSIPLHDFCAARGWELEGRQLFQAAAAAVHAWAAEEQFTDVETTAAVRVLSCYAELEYILGDLDAAEEIFQQCRALLAAVAVEDSPELMFIYKQLGMIAYQRGAYSAAMQHLHFTLEIAEECADDTKIGDTLLSIAAVAYAQGAWDYAEQIVERCLTVYRDLDFEWGIGHAQRFWGMLALARGDVQAASQRYQTSLAIARRLGNRIGEALALDQLGMVYLAEQQLGQSAETLQQALALFQELGIEPAVCRTLCHLGRMAIAQHTYEEAQQHLFQALQTAQRTQAPPLLIESAAGALHLRLCTHPDTSADSSIQAALASLRQHPACSAVTRHYIESFTPYQRVIHRGNSSETDQPWPLQRVQEIVSTLLNGCFKGRPYEIGKVAHARGEDP